jgi:hypothetical protein
VYETEMNNPRRKTSAGRFIQGTCREVSSKGRIIHGTHRPRTNPPKGQRSIAFFGHVTHGHYQLSTSRPNVWIKDLGSTNMNTNTIACRSPTQGTCKQLIVRTVLLFESNIITLSGLAFFETFKEPRNRYQGIGSAAYVACVGFFEHLLRRNRVVVPARQAV